MKKLIVTVLVVAGAGMLLGVPSQTVTNSSFRSGEIAALQKAFSGDINCQEILIATGPLDAPHASDWLSGCTYVQGLLK
jgi:hypothetical protein